MLILLLCACLLCPFLIILSFLSWLLKTSRRGRCPPLPAQGSRRLTAHAFFSVSD